jgi:Ca2+-binding EF-hand superfamily protein
MGSSSDASSPDKKKKKGVLGLFNGLSQRNSPNKKEKKRIGDDQDQATTTTASIPPVPEQVSTTAALPPRSNKQTSTLSSTTTRAAVSPKAASSSWFCRTKYFQQMCDTAFDGIDADGSGEVDAKELYSGLLLIHLKMGCYAGPAACKPLSRERVQTVFAQYDVDGSGCLDREEFRSVMTVLFGNVFFRVLVQWSMTLLFVPMIAQWIVDGAQYLVQSFWLLITSLDEQYKFVDDVEESIERATLLAMHQFAFVNPYMDPLVPYAEQAKRYVEMVPESVWEAIPKAVVSTVLGMVVVPWCIFKVDDFFQKFAEKDVKAAKVKRA